MTAIFPPLYVLIVFTASQSIILLKFIWKKDVYRPDHPISLRNQFSIFSMLEVFAFLATIITALQVFTSQFGLGVNLRYYIVPIAISLVIGSLYLIKIVFLNPTKVSLLIHISVIVYIIVVYVWVIQSYMDIVFLLVPLFLFPLQWVKKLRTQPLLWDIRTKFFKIFTPKLNIILWIIVFVEVFLQYNGYSLIVWG